MIAYYLDNFSPFMVKFGPSFGIRWYGFSYLLAFFCGFLLLLGALAVLTVAYGLVAVSLGGLLLAITSGASYCFRWLKNHRFTGQAGQ